MNVRKAMGITLLGPAVTSGAMVPPSIAASMALHTGWPTPVGFGAGAVALALLSALIWHGEERRDAATPATRADAPRSPQPPSLTLVSGVQQGPRAYAPGFVPKQGEPTLPIEQEEGELLAIQAVVMAWDEPHEPRCIATKQEMELVVAEMRRLWVTRTRTPASGMAAFVRARLHYRGGNDAKGEELARIWRRYIDRLALDAGTVVMRPAP